jgi:hypothetical protein
MVDKSSHKNPNVQCSDVSGASCTLPKLGNFLKFVNDKGEFLDFSKFLVLDINRRLSLMPMWKLKNVEEV